MPSKKHSHAEEEGSQDGLWPSQKEDTSSAVAPAPLTVRDHSSLVSKPRLVIKNIEVDNFKSYAGQHIIGPFHKTFTAVIGPNGSGKSNVIDAMLFVFGKNAKKIRLEKLSELIHSSAAFPNLTRASVTVNFIQVRETDDDKRDPTQRLEVPGSQLSVTREVFRTNVSQYYIDGRKVTQREVVETLTGHGIDLDHNRFLILQGEVQQIALMKPKAEKEGEEGLVEYFDDLIGSNQYLPSIKDATKRVEEYQESRLTSLDALRKVQGERDALSSAKDSTLSFIRKECHLQKIVTVMCQQKLELIEEKLKIPRAKVAALDKDIEGLEGKKQQCETEIKDLAKKDKEFIDSLKGLRGEAEALKKDKSKTEVELEKLKASNEEFEKMKKKEAERLKKLKEDATKLDMDINNFENEQKIAERNHAEASELVVKLQAQFTQKADEVQSMQMPLRKKLVALQKELAPFEETCAQTEQSVQDAKYKLDSVQEAQTRAAENLSRLMEDRQTKLTIVQQDEERLHRAEEGSPELDAALAQLEEKRLKAAKMKYHINSAIATIKNEFITADAVNNVSKLLAAQQLPKYYGSLRDLGRIADEYDVAAGVASGMWDYHVVGDNATAVEVVKILKKEGLRCTMMCLDKITKIHGDEMEKDFRCPSGSQRLFDLIKPVSPMFRIAFYNAVRNTLVVRDIDTARKVAFDSGVRNRVATLRGELIERNGGFSGGGNTPAGAKLKAAHSMPDKEAAVAKMKALNDELYGYVKEEERLTSDIQNLAKQRSDISPDEVRKLRNTVAGLKSMVSALGTSIEKAKVALKEAQAEAKSIDQLEVNLEKANKAAAKAISDRKATAEKVAAVEAELQDVAGPEFRKLSDDLKRNKAMVETSEKAAKEAKSSIQRANVTRKKRAEDIIKVTELIEKMQNEAVEADKKQTKRLEDAIAELGTKLRKVLAEVGLAEGSQAELHHAISNITKRVTKINNDIDTKVREKQEEVSKMKAEQDQIDSVEARMISSRLRVIEFVQEFGVVVLRTHDGDTGKAGRKRGRDRVIAEDIAQDEDDDGERGDGQVSTSSQIHAEDEEEEELEDDDEFDAESFTLKVTPEQLLTYDDSRLKVVARELSTECARLKGNINMEAVQIWRTKQAEYKVKKTDYETVVAAVNKAENELDDLTERRKELFMDNFKIIQRKLKEMYQLLAQGGDADVDLVNSSDPYEGIAFTVRPPKKSWKQVGNLSGGEQTLSSLALVFALHHIKPTPIYVMDEIDAALDFRNVSIVGRYVLEQAQGAQFIIISLRNNMFELAHQLVGICKVNDVTRSLTINPSEVADRIQRQLQRMVAGQRNSAGQKMLLGDTKRSRGEAEEEGAGSQNTVEPKRSGRRSE